MTYIKITTVAEIKNETIYKQINYNPYHDDAAEISQYYSIKISIVAKYRNYFLLN